MWYFFNSIYKILTSMGISIENKNLTTSTTFIIFNRLLRGEV